MRLLAVVVESGRTCLAVRGPDHWQRRPPRFVRGKARQEAYIELGLTTKEVACMTVFDIKPCCSSTHPAMLRSLGRLMRND